MKELEGLLVLDKPAGPTSHDMVAAARRLLGQRRIGHAGTLDPFATGVLPLLLGRATRLSRYLSASRKLYSGTIRLGTTTDTYDLDGRETARSDISGVTEAAIRGTAERFRGRMLQTPPAFSARKVGGRPMHELARAGIAPDPRPAWIEIHRFELTRVEPPDLTFIAETSAGAYIRSIAHDLGQAIGCGAHLASLRRLRAGGASIEDAVSLERLEQACRDGEAGCLIVPPGEIDLGLPTVRVGPSGREAMRAGRGLAPGDVTEGWPEAGGDGGMEPPSLRVLDLEGELLGIAVAPAPSSLPPRLSPRVVLMP